MENYFRFLLRCASAQFHQKRENLRAHYVYMKCATVGMYVNEVEKFNNYVMVAYFQLNSELRTN